MTRGDDALVYARARARLIVRQVEARGIASRDQLDELAACYRILNKHTDTPQVQRERLAAIDPRGRRRYPR